MSIKSRLRLPRNESDRWHQPVDLSWSKHMKTLHKDFTGANRGNGEGELNLCSLRSLLYTSGPGGVVELAFDKSISDGVNWNPERFRGDFVFLARDTASPYIDNRPLLVATKPELREYKAVYVQSDAEIGLFSDKVVVNCAP